MLLACERRCSCLWAGDSRLYLLRDGHLKQLSRDHSQVERLKARGLITAEEARHHPAHNTITRAVGAASTLDLERLTLEIGDGDVFLLCSDGLSNEVEDDQIAGLLAPASMDPAAAADALLKQALDNGGRDNVSVVVIRAEDIGWFTKEIKPAERRALNAVEARDPLLADAYRETLASRLTATRIIKNARRELSLAKKRQNSIRQLKSGRSEDLRRQVDDDIAQIQRIDQEAREVLTEAESRLTMIEAAASRAGGLADSEVALKKLNARSRELPLALESARMTDEVLRELESAGAEAFAKEKDPELSGSE